MFGLELLRTNNPHKYSTLALSLGFWEVLGVFFQVMFSRFRKAGKSNPSLDIQKGKFLVHLYWDAPGVSIFPKQGTIEGNMSKTTIHLHQV